MKHLIGSLLFLFISFQIPFASAKTNADEIYNEIAQVSTKWEVINQKGRIKFHFKLNLNGNKQGYVGDLQGSATFTYKNKKITISIHTKLSKTVFHMAGKYPAFTTVFSGTMTSSDPAVFPVNGTISKKETLILKLNKLCPKNRRMMQKCMKPTK